MDYNERFGQIEAMLADLLRRMDRQAEQMDHQAEQMDRQAKQMDRQGEQIDAIIGILKISDERQTRAEERQTRVEERQEAIMVEVKAQGQRIIEQGQRLDTMLNTQMQMLELMSRQATRTDELTQRMPAIAAYETRMRRLEDAVFNKAS